MTCSRTKTGCLCCRMRRKKCDELRPVCTGCKRNGILCKWPTGQDSKRLSGWRQKFELHYINKSPTEVASEFNWDEITSTPIGEVPCDKNADQLTQLNDFVIPSPSNFIKDSGITQALASSPDFGPLANGSPFESSRLQLLEHYFYYTAPKICGRADDNPFIVYVMPRALVDPLLRYSILSISAAHLANSTGNQQFAQLTWICYGTAIKGLNNELEKLQSCAVSREKLALLLLMLCHVEIVVGDSSGNIFRHLRACREIIAPTLKCTSSHNEGINVFLAELYSYLVIVANVTFNSKSSDRSLIFDQLVFSLTSLRASKFSGFMLGCAHEIFELIPQISILAQQRLKALESPIDPFEMLSLYSSVGTKLREWTPPSDCQAPDLILAGKIYQQAALLFLHTSFHGPRSPDDTLSALIDQYLSEALFLAGQLTPDAPIFATMAWPALIAGSCIRDKELQQILANFITTAHFDMGIQNQLILLLRWVWDNQHRGGEYFGPWGIELAMREKNINVSIG